MSTEGDPKKMRPGLRFFVIALLAGSGVAVLASQVRQRWCGFRMDGEAVGGFPAETFGEYRDYVDEFSDGCGSVVLIGPDGREIDDPDPAVRIEPMTGEMLSSPITVYLEGQVSPRPTPPTTERPEGDAPTETLPDSVPSTGPPSGLRR